MHTFSQQCVILKFVCFVTQNITQYNQRGCWGKWFRIVWKKYHTTKITQDDSGEELGFKVLSGYLFIGTVCKNDSVLTFTKK